MAIDPPHTLALTWRWWNELDADETVVTASLVPAGSGGTLLTLRHERFPDETARANHDVGWTQ